MAASKIKAHIKALAKPHRTSIGHSARSRPKFKHWRKRRKKSVGQG